LEPGESVLLVNYEHQPAHSPFRSRHAIFVREGAEETRLYVAHASDLAARLRCPALDGRCGCVRG
jgi:hypothetical protein